MKKALIIGAAGFVGSYLIDHIQKNCIWSIVVTKMPHEAIDRQDIEVLDLDIMDCSALTTVIQGCRPDYIFHLAAQSSVALSWKNPALTVDVNVKGSINVLEAIRTLDYSPRILMIGSGEEYGHILPNEVPINEHTMLRPGNIYAATKACQNMIGGIYAKAYNMNVIMVRAFNHVGPNQAPAFVVADFCKQVAEIEAGMRPPVIRVGNLEAKRDFSDVRDVVRAYTKLIQSGAAGETYNIGSGHAVPIKEILDKIISMSNKTIEVQTDITRLRPVDVPIIEADLTKLKMQIDWNPEISIDETILETLNYWRNKVLGD